MEVTVKKKIGFISDMEDVIKEIKRLEKEYNCTCTLLEIEVKN